MPGAVAPAPGTPRPPARGAGGQWWRDRLQRRWLGRLRRLEVAPALDRVHVGGVHAVLQCRERDGIRVRVERGIVVVRERVAGQVVAGVVLLPGRAAPDRGFGGRLDAFGTG